MFFRFMSLVMLGIVALFATSFDVEHAFHAALLPGVAAIGIYLLATA